MEFSSFYGRSETPSSAGTGKAIRVIRALEHLQPRLRAMKDEYKLNYAATEPSRFRRTRYNLGGTADAHYQNEFRFWEMREYVRDMDRNDPILGQLVNRALDNILGCGMEPEPLTGDPGFNVELKERWNEHKDDPRLVSSSWRFTFADIERLLLRHVFVDGDVCAVPHPETVQLQLLEGQRLTSPPSFDNVVHGVELDVESGRVMNYFFLKSNPDQHQVRLRRVPVSVTSDMLTKVPAFDALGEPQVYHVLDPDRITQHRGVTAFHAVFDTLGMLEDVNFARLVQQQVVSCIAAFITRTRDFQWGNREEETEDDGTTTYFEELSPGLTARLRPGEDIKGFSPNVPNPEYLDFVSLILRMIGAALGMPLELVLLDTTRTTFHGYRGVLQQARKSFERKQKWFPRQFHRPYWRRLLRHWFPDWEARLRRDPFFFRHNWKTEGWPYVDPKTDVQADNERLRNGLISPRRLQRERGHDWDEVKQEIVQDWESAIDLAMEAAQRLNEKYDTEEISWRDMLNLNNPTGQTVSVARTEGEDQKEEEDGGGEQGGRVGGGLRE